MLAAMRAQRGESTTRSWRRPSRRSPRSVSRAISPGGRSTSTRATENERRQAETELASLEPARGRRALRRHRECARDRRVRHGSASSSTCSTTSCSRTRFRPRSASGSSSSRPRSGRTLLAPPRSRPRRGGRRHRDQADPARERRPGWSAARRGRRRRPSARPSRTTSGSSRGCATSRRARSGTATGSRSRSRPQRARRGQAPRHARGLRPSDGRALRALEVRTRRAAGGALRLHRGRAAAVALRRPVLPGDTTRRRRRPRSALPRSGHRRVGEQDVRRHRDRRRTTSSPGAISTRARASASTRSASTSTATATFAC